MQLHKDFCQIGICILGGLEAVRAVRVVLFLAGKLTSNSASSIFKTLFWLVSQLSLSKDKEHYVVRVGKPRGRHVAGVLMDLQLFKAVIHHDISSCWELCRHATDVSSLQWLAGLATSSTWHGHCHKHRGWRQACRETWPRGLGQAVKLLLTMNIFESSAVATFFASYTIQILFLWIVCDDDDDDDDNYH